MKFSGKVGNEPINKRLNFGGDPDPYRDTGKTCLGGGNYFGVIFRWPVPRHVGLAPRHLLTTTWP